ncbi:MAG: hypothetical protein FWH40_03575 [Coriobacteriia bacterium]|nr:hypothetical protein [Coriobacteriia bacterium]
MSELNERENVLRLYRGEMPEWVPISQKAFAMCMPMAILGGPGGGPGGPRVPGTITYNILGTPHIVTSDPNIAPMPIPGEPHVPDITHWRDYLKFPFPDPNELDWSRDVEVAKNVDRENRAVVAMVGGASFAGAPFNAMVDILGHEGASIAMLDEDEQEYWHELLGFLTDWEVAVVNNLIRIYQPDIVCTCDDLANAHGPFMSLPTYREMLLPYQARVVKAITDAGCYAEIHCCGKADAFIDDWFEIGLTAWNPAQVFNDIEEIKARYGRSFVINGGYDSQGKINIAGAAEADVRASIRLSFQKYAPGGSYIFSTSGMALAHELGEEHMGWISDEAEKCSSQYYL